MSREVVAVERRGGCVTVREPGEEVEVERPRLRAERDLVHLHRELLVQREVPPQHLERRGQRLERPHLAVRLDRRAHDEREPSDVCAHVDGEVARPQQRPDRSRLPRLELTQREDLRVGPGVAR